MYKNKCIERAWGKHGVSKQAVGQDVEHVEID